MTDLIFTKHLACRKLCFPGSKLSRASVVFALALLSGCAALPESVTGRDVVPVLSVPVDYQAEQNQDSKIINGLMELFDDEALNTFVQQALGQNLDIQLAARQVEDAGYIAAAERGSLLPGVAGNLSGSRSRSADSTTGTSYSPSLDVSWELDIWGKLQSQKAALDASALAQAEHYQAVRDSIAAQLMQGWFDVITLEKQVTLEQARLANLQTSENNSRRQYRSGLGKLDDMDAVRRDMAQARATLIDYQSRRNIAARALQTLAGHYPDGQINPATALPELIERPPAGVPSDLLTERPDVRKAWQEVLVADHSVNVAHKELFPSLSLTGSLGSQSSTFSDLVSGATVWSLAGSLAQPLFDAGQLENTMRAEHSKAEQAWVNYLQVVLGAFAEVEQALDRETLLAQQEQRQQEAVVHAENTARLFADRYRNGLVSILEYLAAQDTVFDMKSQLLQVRNERLKNRVSLALALGEGV